MIKNISTNSIEAVIEKIYKLNGTERVEYNTNELTITEKDNSVIDLDVVIKISEQCFQD